jgi:AraC-like DNA-binding protein
MTIPEMPTAYAVMMIRDALLQGDDLLYGLNFALEDIENKEYFHYEDYLVILDRYTRWNDQADWGFTFGNRLGITSHGGLGFGAISAPTARDGLALLSKYIGTRTPYTHSYIETQNDAIRVVFESHQNIDRYRQRVCETLCMVFQSYIESIGATTTPTLWHFPFPQPENSEHYGRWIHGGFVFSAEKLMFDVPGSVAMVVSPFHNEVVYQSSIAQCEEILAAREEDTTLHVVRRILNEAYQVRIEERVPSKTIPNAETVAIAMGVSKRTLIRRLKSCETTFQTLRDELLRKLIMKQIQENKKSLSEISLQLGYQDAGNFSRACKRLFGYAPSALRTQILTR